MTQFQNRCGGRRDGGSGDNHVSSELCVYCCLGRWALVDMGFVSFVLSHRWPLVDVGVAGIAIVVLVGRPALVVFAVRRALVDIGFCRHC